jgi:hypothetical protein
MNVLNGRLDISSVTPVGGTTDEWVLEGTVIDNTGVFSAMDAKLGDVVYSDCALLGLGALRFKITTIDVATNGAFLRVILKWDMLEAQPSGWTTYDYPLQSSQAVIGATDDLGTMAITSMFVNGVDEFFIAAIRNVESTRHSKYLSISNPSLTTNNPIALQPELPVPSEDSSVLFGNKDRSLSWSQVVDSGTF